MAEQEFTYLQEPALLGILRGKEGLTLKLGQLMEY